MTAGRRRVALGLALLLAAPAALVAAESAADAGGPGIDPSWLEALPYRNLGPFRAGSWVTDIAAPETPADAALTTFYVAARNGGVWKTTNAGTTFANLTDAVGIAAVGDLAVAPSDGSVIWVGTGDAENARSSYSGTGVYRSLDGGETFTHQGLEDTRHVARIVIHPRDPDVVFVAAMGHLFSPNPERGVYKTTDGGATWRHVLDLGPEVGVIDLVMRAGDPRVLLAAAYDKQRLPWHFEAGGERSGLYRSTDGGATWERIGGGFPTGKIGRIGIDQCRARPDVLYAIVENLNERPPTEEEAKADREAGKEPEERPIGNQVYRSDDGGLGWRLVSPEGVAIGSKSAYAFNEVRVDPENPDLVYVTSETLISSADGGKTWRDRRWPPTELFAEMFGDVRTLWIDPHRPQRLLLGSDGGVFPSVDGGRTIDHLANLPLGEVYALTADLERPYHVYVGLQDHEAWRGPVDSWSGAVTDEDWVIVGKWDGMVSQVDPSGRWYYGTTQFGNHVRADLELGRRVTIQPEATEGEPEYRFTWTTPLVLSSHDPDVVYTGAQLVLRSSDRGDSWEELSPDLTTNDPKKIAGEGHIHYCTITSIAESPLDPRVLWAGTDDGKVWVTRDLGETWTERTGAAVAAGAPRDLWVSRVVASAHAPGRAYLAKSGYRRDDFGAYLYRTDDFGASWTAIAGDLDAAPISVVAEDPVNPELLFVGNDRGVRVSLDGGSRWLSLQNDMPIVPVRDLLVHPRENDLIVGTYGRGVWITDVHPLRELRQASTEPAHLFAVEPHWVQLTERAEWGEYHRYGDRRIEVPNRPDGLVLYYSLTEAAESVTLRIERPGSGVLAVIDAPAEPGLHRLVWRTRLAAEDPEEPVEIDARRREAGREAGDEDGEAAEEAGEEQAAAAEAATENGEDGDEETVTAVRPGEVVVVLAVDGAEQRRRSRLLEPPPLPVR